VSDDDVRSEAETRGASGGESTVALIQRVKSGDTSARDVLLIRFLVPMRRWAHGRLPARARDLLDTDDLVQETFLRTLNHLHSIPLDGEGSFLAYLRRVLLNRITDQIRRVDRWPGRGTLPDPLPDGGPSPLEAAIGHEALERYDHALQSLPGMQQEAIMMRFEMGFGYDEVAAALGYPTPNAARAAITRALVRLVRTMKAIDGRAR
jgi:RNA polymerase sigma-70 factor (ECF subfamily)